MVHFGMVFLALGSLLAVSCKDGDDKKPASPIPTPTSVATLEPSPVAEEKQDPMIEEKRELVIESLPPDPPRVFRLFSKKEDFPICNEVNLGLIVGVAATADALSMFGCHEGNWQAFERGISFFAAPLSALKQKDCPIAGTALQVFKDTKANTLFDSGEAQIGSPVTLCSGDPALRTPEGVAVVLEERDTSSNSDICASGGWKISAFQDVNKNGAVEESETRGKSAISACYALVSSGASNDVLPVSNDVLPASSATYTVGPFVADYFNDMSLVATGEVAPHISMNYSYSAFKGIPSENLRAVWRGPVQVSGGSIALRIGVDLSWSAVKFKVNGVQVGGWTNNSKAIVHTFLEGTHQIEVEYENNWHTTGFNVSFDRYDRLAADVLAPKLKNLLDNETKLLAVGAYESSDFHHEFRIDLSNFTGDVVLLAGSYHQIRWKIINPNDAKIKAVVLASYGPQPTVEGVGTSTLVVGSSDKNGYGQSDLVGISQALFGRSPEVMTSTYDGQVSLLPTPSPVPVAPTPSPVPVAPTPSPVPVAPTPSPVPVAPTPSPVPVAPTPSPTP